MKKKSIEIPIDITVRKTWIGSTLIVATAAFVGGKCKDLDVKRCTIDEALKGGYL